MSFQSDYSTGRPSVNTEASHVHRSLDGSDTIMFSTLPTNLSHDETETDPFSNLFYTNSNNTELSRENSPLSLSTDPSVSPDTSPNALNHPSMSKHMQHHRFLDTHGLHLNRGASSSLDSAIHNPFMPSSSIGRGLLNTGVTASGGSSGNVSPTLLSKNDSSHLSLGNSNNNPNLPADTIKHLLQEQSLKRQRLARKAELARLSRFRKKTRLTDLEVENRNLQEEITRLSDLRGKYQTLLMHLTQNMAATGAGLDSRSKEFSKAMKDAGIKETKHRDVLDQQVQNIDFTSLPKLQPGVSSGSNGAQVQMPLDDQIVGILSVLEAQLTPPSAADAKPSSFGGSADETTAGARKNKRRANGSIKKNSSASSASSSSTEGKSSENQSDSEQLKFLKWMFSRRDSNFSDPKSLAFNLFTQELKCTPDQLKQLDSSRNKLHSLMSEKSVEKLRKMLETYAVTSWTGMDDLISVLNVTQLQSLNEWIMRYGDAWMGNTTAFEVGGNTKQ